MRKLQRSDIQSNAEYVKKRDEMRRAVMAHKAVRRAHLGDILTLTFETREAMTYQVQEMMRVEHIEDETAIARELETYNELVPEANQLCATLFVELTSDADLREWLPKLVGVDSYVSLQFDGHKVAARSEPGRNREDKTSSVHYIWFDFSPEQSAALQKVGSASLHVDHPNYSRSVDLSRDTLVALRDDLTRE